MGVIPINFGVEAEVFVRQQRNMSRYVNELVVKYGINGSETITNSSDRQLCAAFLNRLDDQEGTRALANLLIDYLGVVK